MRVRKKHWRSPATGKTESVYFMDYVCPVEKRRKRENLPGITSKAMAERIASKKFEEFQIRATLGEDAGPSMFQQFLTLGQMLTDDLERPGIAPRTQLLDKTRHKALNAILGDATAVIAITTKQLETYQVKRTGQKCGARGVNGELATLKAAITRAVKSRLVDRLPCLFPDKLPEVQTSKRALTMKEIGQLVRSLKKADPKLLDTIVVMAYTGMRPGQLYGLTWADYDGHRKTLAVKSRKRGSGGVFKVRIVPCIAPVADALSRQKKKGAGRKDLIFGIAPELRGRSSNRKQPGHCNGDVYLQDHKFPEKLRAAAKLAKLSSPEEITPYTLRRSFATNYPGDVVELQRILGHSDIRTTLEIYRQSRPESMLKAIQKMEVKAQGGHSEKKKTAARPRAARVSH